MKLKVKVPLKSQSECTRILNTNRRITPNQLCAGGEEGKDSCEGDSGGPLMRTYEDLADNTIQWYQEGVVSWGVQCGRAHLPAVYTRVARYMNWILNRISED